VMADKGEIMPVTLEKTVKFKWIGIENWEGSRICVECVACSSWRRDIYTHETFVCGCCKKVIK
jgi:hypothetical protein